MLPSLRARPGAEMAVLPRREHAPQAMPHEKGRLGVALHGPTLHKAILHAVTHHAATLHVVVIYEPTLRGRPSRGSFEGGAVLVHPVHHVRKDGGGPAAAVFHVIGMRPAEAGRDFVYDGGRVKEAV
jgi:hypothetical protein